MRFIEVVIIDSITHVREQFLERLRSHQCGIVLESKAFPFQSGTVLERKLPFTLVLPLGTVLERLEQFWKGWNSSESAV